MMSVCKLQHCFSFLDIITSKVPPPKKNMFKSRLCFWYLA